MKLNNYLGLGLQTLGIKTELQTASKTVTGDKFSSAATGYLLE